MYEVLKNKFKNDNLERACRDTLEVVNDSSQTLCLCCLEPVMFSTELELTENSRNPPLRSMTLEDAKVALGCDVSRENKKGLWHLCNKRMSLSGRGGFFPLSSAEN